MEAKIINKNGKIEFFRFFFSVSVLLYHIKQRIIGGLSFKNGVHISFFSHGAISVEFFFILSGFFMARSIYKNRYSDQKLSPYNEMTLSQNTVNFIKKKYMSVFPQHLIAFLFAFISLVLLKGYSVKEILFNFFNSIPNLFLVQMSGISFTNPNSFEWYISSMIIAMVIIYPICYKYYYNFTRFVAPISALLILGYMVHTTGGISSGFSVWLGVCYKSTLRAIAEISLGTTAFEICRYLQQHNYTKKQRMIFTLVEIGCFVGTVVFLIFTFQLKFEIYALMLLFVLIVIVLSEQSYGEKIFKNKFVYFLGKLSLPIYIGQITAFNITKAYLFNCTKATQIISAIVITFILTFPITYLGNKISMLIKKS